MQDRRRLVVAINPSASFGRGRDAGALVVGSLRAAGHEVTGLLRPSLAELDTAVRQELAGRRPDALVVVGGDGMVHFGARHVAGTDRALGIVPSGTGNDLARGLGLPLGDPDAAVRVLLEALRAPARRVDAIRATPAGGDPVWVVGAISAGFDALVTERANRMRRPRGASRYTIALVRELAALRPMRYRIELDGVARDESGVLLAVANNGWIGGGMHIAPDARVDDGELDVLLVTPVGRLRFLALFPRVFSGRHTTLPMVRLERARRGLLESDVPIAAYGDGERLGPLPIEFEVVHGALRVLAPGGESGF
ncbi:diacylglycerol kinase family protein [Naasia sp. SYSU D00057]|uniref:diacylglycerol/lipid kinase family protein n=1 Tax=Naasia sp. SYSU D00057 TaxID=2817380 RepID=UPI0027DCA0AF|nr:diacylglycerol kinase family protein [Naasia sp. SYSU D00057]